MMDPLYLLVGGAIALVCGLIVWGTIHRRSSKQAAVFEPGRPVHLKPMLTEAQIGFYNLLRLAVRDRYLIFAQVPLWCVVDVPLPENGSRVPLLSQLALKRAAFVLIHPGTRQAEKVVEWKGENGSDPAHERPDPLLAAVLESAGIELILIHARRSYAVADLVALFDCGDGDS